MKRFLASLLSVVALTLASVAPTDAQQPTPLAEYHKAVVRVGQWDADRQGGSFSATGTLIARDENNGIVVTVSHVFDGPSAGQWVDWGDGRRVKARILGQDNNLDIAAMVTDAPPSDVPAIPLGGSAEYASSGDVVEFVGYGGGQFRHFTASVVGYADKNSPGQYTQVRTAFRPISGDSGGPLLFRGKVVGVQWGGPGDFNTSGATESHATWCGSVENFLTQCRGPYCPQPRYSRPVPQAVPPAPRPATNLQPVAPRAPPQAVPPCKCQPADNTALLARLEKLESDNSALAQGKGVIDGLELKIQKLEASLIALQLPGPVAAAGPRGEPGPQGKQGLRGESGPAGKSCECKVGDGATRPPMPVFFDIKPRKQGK